ncbi:uncharacterized protein LOC134835033 [Culicoides brevitarsis]|uniref:uncharacterized protein LOC134835033 n=1 Tax=Culicoides brevitarsis TaxID=469753 RepID=UPI00307CC3EF
MAVDEFFPRIQNFLCCIDMRNGIVFIAIISFLASIADIVYGSFSLHEMSVSKTSVGTILIYTIMLMSLGFFEFLLSLFLLYGVCKYETAHLFVYLWLKVIGNILLFISMVLAFMVHKWIGVGLVVELVCSIYFFFCIHSYYKRMRTYYRKSISY